MKIWILLIVLAFSAPAWGIVQESNGFKKFKVQKVEGDSLIISRKGIRYRILRSFWTPGEMPRMNSEFLLSDAQIMRWVKPTNQTSKNKGIRLNPVNDQIQKAY